MAPKCIAIKITQYGQGVVYCGQLCWWSIESTAQKLKISIRVVGFWKGCTTEDNLGGFMSIENDVYHSQIIW